MGKGLDQGEIVFLLLFGRDLMGRASVVVVDASKGDVG